MEVNISVQIEPFAKSHFIRSFEKKYKIRWEITLRAIIAELEHIDVLLLTSKAETISDSDGLRFIKTKFKVAGTKESAKTSGNRCIVVWNARKQFVSVLLVYNKTDLRASNETAEWKKTIRDNYPEYRNIL